MNAMFWGLLGLFFGFVVIVAILARMRRQVGGGFGPTEMSDGSITASPTGYPEEMKGSGKKISPLDNQAGRY
jgi:hypothetical protein